MLDDYPPLNASPPCLCFNILSLSVCLSVRRVVELTGDVTPDMRAIAQADLIVTTPEKWDGVSRSWQNRSYVQKVAILIIDEIHLLGKYSHNSDDLLLYSF